VSGSSVLTTISMARHILLSVSVVFMKVRDDVLSNRKRNGQGETNVRSQREEDVEESDGDGDEGEEGRGPGTITCPKVPYGVQTFFLRCQPLPRIKFVVNFLTGTPVSETTKQSADLASFKASKSFKVHRLDVERLSCTRSAGLHAFKTRFLHGETVLPVLLFLLRLLTIIAGALIRRSTKVMQFSRSVTKDTGP
jgi:hypothetical protein